jgi:hypothetical protein
VNLEQVEIQKGFRFFNHGLILPKNKDYRTKQVGNLRSNPRFILNAILTGRIPYQWLFKGEHFIKIYLLPPGLRGRLLLLTTIMVLQN